MTQTWLDLLFAHWPIDPELIAPTIPADVELDLFDGRAWLGVVPFRMANVGPRGVPALPGVSAFAELNVRTYVRAGGKPGVFFYSLDAASLAAVLTARALLNLPYFPAAMQVAVSDGWVSYRSRRTHGGAAELVASYRPVGEAFAPQPGSLEYFLTERYCLYGVGRTGRTYILEIHHPPWPIQPAEARFERNTMAQAAGFTLPDTAPLLHFAKRQDTVAWVPGTMTPSSC
jgi:uncharacterized protein YqjF (DUF2071 family)